MGCLRLFKKDFRNLLVIIVFENSHQIQIVVEVELDCLLNRIHCLVLQIKILYYLIGYLILFHLVLLCWSLEFLFLLGILLEFKQIIVLMTLISHLIHSLLLLLVYFEVVFQVFMVNFYILLIFVAFFEL